MHRGPEEKRREEKEERYCREARSRNFVTPFIEYNKDKVPVDVATSLVVNQVKSRCIVSILCLCLCLRMEAQI